MESEQLTDQIIDALTQAETAVRQVLMDQAHASKDQTVRRASAMFQAETFATAAIVNLKAKYRDAPIPDQEGK